MMIFDVDSGEFWQTFARQGMRILRNPQLERGEVCIEDIELDLKSRDDILALLIGLQYLYVEKHATESQKEGETAFNPSSALSCYKLTVLPIWGR